MNLDQNWFTMLLLGLLQGSLEWLPVSSSGQAVIFYGRLLSLDSFAGYELGIIAHLGTGLSGLVILYREFIDALKGGIWLRVAFIPLIISLPVGFVVYRYFSSVALSYSLLVELVTGVFLLVTGFLLLAISKVEGKRVVESLTLGDFVVVGLLQGLSILPGLSRSAVTIAGYSLLGLNGRDSVRASFFMGIPATISAALYRLFSAPLGSYSVSSVDVFILALSSFIAGLVSMWFMVKLGEKSREEIGLLLVVIGFIIVVFNVIPIAGA